MRILLDDLFEVVPTPTDVEFKDIPHTFESAKNARNVHPMVGSAANVAMDQMPESQPDVKKFSPLTPLLRKFSSSKQVVAKIPTPITKTSPIGNSAKIQSMTAIGSEANNC